MVVVVVVCYSAVFASGRAGCVHAQKKEEIDQVVIVLSS